MEEIEILVSNIVACTRTFSSKYNFIIKNISPQAPYLITSVRSGNKNEQKNIMLTIKLLGSDIGYKKYT